MNINRDRNHNSPLKRNTRFDSLKSSDDSNPFQAERRPRRDSPGRFSSSGSAYSRRPAEPRAGSMPLPKLDDEPVAQSSNSTGGYVAPALRRRQEQSNSFRSRTGKNAPKKEFEMTTEAFPTLGADPSPPPEGESVMNFVGVVTHKEKAPKPQHPKTPVPPGWVSLSRDPVTHELVIEHGPETEWRRKWREDAPLREKRRQSALTLAMITRWQNERDELNDIMGDMSPYWGEKNLLEDDDEDEEYGSDYLESDEDCAAHDQYDEWGKIRG